MKNNLADRMERALSKYAIPNITLYLIMGYAVGYVIAIVQPQFIYFLTLEPGYILKGQIWRLFTWLLIPPESSNLFFTLIILYFYYSIGRTLEVMWGTYKLNLYLISGMVFTIIGSFILYGILTAVRLSGGSVGFGMAFSTYYINMSLFLAYAATFPEMRVLLFFVIPIKVKVLGIIYGILLLLSCVQGGILTWVVIGSSLLNFIIFFFTYLRGRMGNPQMMKQRYRFRAEVAKETAPPKMTGITRHKCAICGQTEETNRTLEFRFCSKCNGNYEYCSEHLFTHEHVK